MQGATGNQSILTKRIDELTEVVNFLVKRTMTGGGQRTLENVNSRKDPLPLEITPQNKLWTTSCKNPAWELTISPNLFGESSVLREFVKDQINEDVIDLTKDEKGTCLDFTYCGTKKNDVYSKSNLDLSMNSMSPELRFVGGSAANKRTSGDVSRLYDMDKFSEFLTWLDDGKLSER